MECMQWDEYADCYHSHIISPLQDGVKNPLLSELDAMDANIRVADIGSGRGDLLPHLKKFEKVYAIDFSRKMLRKAEEKANAENIRFIQADMRSLSRLGITFDVAVAVNSILQPDTNDVDRSLQEIYMSLAKGGVLKAVFPSMEAVLYHFQLVYEDQLSRCRSPGQTLRNTKKIVERSKYSIITSTYTDGAESQKFYYKFELRNRLKKAGFVGISFKKVLYPWGNASGDYEDFPDMPPIWDWYVSARK